MPFTTEDNLLTLDAGLAHFKAVYMPARNYSKRTREEYESDLSDLISFLTARDLTDWRVVGLRDLQSYLADGMSKLDRAAATPAGGAGHDQAARPASWTSPDDLLPHFPSYRDHHILAKWWYN